MKIVPKNVEGIGGAENYHAFLRACGCAVALANALPMVSGLRHRNERARGAGYGRVQISFFVGNQAAERAYIKAGFKFAEEKRSPEFQAALGVPGLRRFARNIASSDLQQ